MTTPNANAPPAPDRPGPKWAAVLDYLTGERNDPGDLTGLASDLAARFGRQRPNDPEDADERRSEAERLIADYLAHLGAEPAPELRRLLAGAPALAAILAELRQDMGPWRARWLEAAKRAAALVPVAAAQVAPAAPTPAIPTEPAGVWGTDGTLLGMLVAKLNDLGEVVAEGFRQFFGPAPVPVGVVPHLGPEAPEARWEIPTNRGYSVTIRLKPIEEGEAWELACGMEGPSAAATEAVAAVEVRTQDGRLVVSGPFAELRSHPVRIAPGDLRLKLSVGGDWRVLLVRVGGTR